MDAGAAKGAGLGFMAFGPPGALVGGGIGALGSVIDARINGTGAGKSAEQLMNNPPTADNEGRRISAATSGGQPPGASGPSGGSSGGDDDGPPPMFSALDERNLSTLVTKSMYSVVN